MTALNHNLMETSVLKRPGFSYRILKRMADIVLSLASLLLFSPILLIAIAQIYLRDGRPIFYRQWRVGQDGWLFEIIKLRTMRHDAERVGEAQFAEKFDPRIIPGCQWIRQSHVDELPQLWNILVGHMSLVGPRPERPEMMSVLQKDVEGMDLRLLAPPGLTGLAQIRNGYTNDVEGARRKLAWDLEYIKNRSFLGECFLLLRTLPKFWDRSAN